VDRLPILPISLRDNCIEYRRRRRGHLREVCIIAVDNRFGLLSEGEDVRGGFASVELCAEASNEIGETVVRGVALQVLGDGHDGIVWYQQVSIVPS
jgi:hypothetical protein